MLKSATPGGAIFLNNFSATNTLTVNAVIADNTSASGLGTVGAVVLNGTNTYTGATMVDSGVLSVRNSAGLGGVAGGTSVQFGAALELQGGAGLSIGAESLTLSGTGISNGGALRSISGNNTWTGTVTLASDARINSDADSLTLNAASSITAIDRNLILGGAGNGAVTGSISTGAGTLTKDGAGTWTLSGVNTYTSETKLSNGTLSVGANASLGNGGALIFDGGTLKYTGASDTANRVLTINAGKIAIFDISQAGANLTVTGASPATSGALTKNGPGTLTLTGTQGYTGATNVNSGALSIGGGAILPALASSGITLANNSNVTFNHSDTATYGKAIVGTGSFTKSGTGTLTLTVAQTYNGSTLIDGGTLKLHSDPSYRYYRFSIYSLVNSDLAQMSELAFYSSGTNNVTGTRVFPTTATGDGGNYGDQLIPSLSDNDLNTKCTYNGLPSSTQFGRYITFDFGATTMLSGYDWSTANDQTPNRNPNNFTLFGSNDGNTFTVVNAQTNAGSTPTTTFTWAPGWATGQVNNPLPTTTDLTISSTGILALDGANQQIASLAGASGASVTNSGTTDKVLTISGTSTTTFSGVISNGATNIISLVKAGNGTQILTGPNTYTGTTTINTGTLQLGNGDTTGAISKDSIIVVNGAGTLAINRSNTTKQNEDFGRITGTGGFTQAGSGTTIFNLVNTYTGDTNVNAGTLAANVSGTVSGSTIVQNGGTLAGDGGTFGNVTVKSGGAFSPGDPIGNPTATLTVNGNLVLETSSNFNVQFDVGAGYLDAITVNGDLNITIAPILNDPLPNDALLNVSYIGQAPDPNPFPNEIITYSGTWNGGTFLDLSDDSTFTSEGITYLISYNDDSMLLSGYHAVTLTIVPEPGAAVSLLGGLGLLLGVRRRRAIS
jgi:autotransporter-associated beta strand protein